ncbi:hypothetical protein PanWU01x14_052250 [Parasponia andersonii]|uniref:Uncharacterized protein n=1 Tax=Parasponia andersonii TaxID=3476 RepID=A0A2P5DM81_PARAD|nr:hypothetical protein PanWU01x14_052250 [Parasponia andersonii]
MPLLDKFKYLKFFRLLNEWGSDEAIVENTLKYLPAASTSSTNSSSCEDSPAPREYQSTPFECASPIKVRRCFALEERPVLKES